MKISILTSDFSHNCFGRAWLLAKLLQRHYDIEVIGPAFNNGIWKPLKNACDFETKIVKGHTNGRFEFRKMLASINGDVIYASKPRMASFGVGLIKKISTGKPLVLDIDDPELGEESYNSLNWCKKVVDFCSSFLNWSSFHYSIIFNKFIYCADSITVSGNVLQSRYGGTVVWHGRDKNFFDPEKYNNLELRKKYLTESDRDLFIASFIGTPRPHKGLEDLFKAMELLRHDKIILMVVGADDDEYCKKVKELVDNSIIKHKVLFFHQQPFENIPEFLSISDIITIPQRARIASNGQVPAKIFDAMAMAKPILGTAISEIPEILDDCGWIVSPESPGQLADILKYASEHPNEAKEKGLRARENFRQRYAWDIIEEPLIELFGKYRKALVG